VPPFLLRVQQIAHHPYSYFFKYSRKLLIPVSTSPPCM
jgi:hypothetical protein